jgi:hypothetical protein
MRWRVGWLAAVGMLGCADGTGADLGDTGTSLGTSLWAE